MELSELINFQSNKNRLEEIKNNRRNIIPFVGAGISKQCGLYTWGELLHQLAVDYLTVDEINQMEYEGNFFGYADRIVSAAGNSDMIMKRIREILAETEVVLTDTPYLLVSSFSPMVVTTNYDTLLENASIYSPLGTLKALLPCLAGQMNEAIQINDRRLLKIHGSVEEATSFIFTTEQYKKFYGKKGHRENKILPAYLKKIFTGKKVLFVGCSLDKDNTLEILEECVQKDRSISHFAIVPYPSDPDKQIKRKREFTRLGIEPIYYPEGDFQAVSRLINYLAEENHFILSMNQILSKILGDTQKSKYQLRVLLSILKESYYSTALQFPELLDIDNQKDDFTSDILECIGTSRHQKDTLLSICQDAFSAYAKAGYLRCEKEAVVFFSKQFEDRALKETEIENMLQKRWSINRNLLNETRDELTWITDLSNEEINDYAADLLQKLQYQNGMNFAEIAPVYGIAKQFIRLAEERIRFDIRIRLLNSLGAFGHYYGDSNAAVAYLERCINEIERCGSTDRQLMLFKAKCYANLAIARSLNSADVIPAIKAAEQDIFLKRTYNESAQLYSRSLNFYATVLKEVNPFQACDIYLEAAEIKEKLISDEHNENHFRELTASWATTVFNIGLLAKDLELYDLAYRIVCYANEYRFKTVDYCNRDYCSSINVRAELEMFVHKEQQIKWLISGVESRIDLPNGFSGTLAHTWYVCAYYYYLRKEYSTAIKYINKSLNASKKEGALVDFRQDMRTRLLLGDVKAAQARIETVYRAEAEAIYKNIIDSIINMYGHDSYYLIAPYRHLMQVVESIADKNECNHALRLINEKNLLAVKEAEMKLEKYMAGRDL